MKKICTIAFILALGIASAAMGAPEKTASAPIDKDRWLEIDLYWFERSDIKGSADKFWERMAPLFREVGGHRGVVVNIGWLMDFIFEWSGDLGQQIPVPKNMRLQPFFKDAGLLTGTSGQRRELWQKRAAGASDYKVAEYEPWTYKELKELVAVLRKSAAAHGLKDMKIGTMALGWAMIYQGNKSSFFAKHPMDIYAGRPGTFDPMYKLTADPTHYGAYPQGIPGGLAITEFFGRQWGDLSRKVGFDMLVLRDSSIGIGVYQRQGPYGYRGPEDPEVLRRWSAAYADLVRQTKQANPSVFLMGYSSAASAVADWRINCFDLESIAKEGFLDAYIDQTWAGAWNEVGQRFDPAGFWNIVTLGWSYQLAYTLLHAAVLSETPCKHYILTETFDAWESWDVIGTVPDRLRWGIWAYSHAAVKRPGGLKFPDGSYISWANQGKMLLDETLVDWLAAQTNAAQRDLAEITDVCGPTLVYSRSAMEWQNANAPATFIKEWIDEQAGTLSKWGVPILSSARIENLDKIESDLFIIQTPVHLKSAELASVGRLADSGKPLLLIGSPWNGIDKSLLQKVGLSAVPPKEGTRLVEFRGSLDGKTGPLYENCTNTFLTPHFYTVNKLDTTGGARSYYSVSESPTLVRKGNLMVWDAPELQRNVSPEKGRYPLDVMIGSPVPYVVLARMLTADLRSAEAFCSRSQDIDMPVWCGAWKLRDGSVEVLAGEIEEGLDHSGKMAAPLRMWFPAPLQGRCMVSEQWRAQRYIIPEGSMDYVLRKGESCLLRISEL